MFFNNVKSVASTLSVWLKSPLSSYPGWPIDLPKVAFKVVKSVAFTTLKLVKPCTRCVITSTDQRTGERSMNPLPYLREFRFNRELLGVTFGENAVVSSGIGTSIERGAECVLTFDA